MKPTKYFQRALLSLFSAAILALVAWAAGSNWLHSESSAVQPKPTPVRSVYFGDLHIHTGWSNDAYNIGTRATPDDAYLYAKGEGIRLPSGEIVKLIKPLDFMGVTEHAEYQGIMSKLQDPKSLLYNHPFAIDLRSKDMNVRINATIGIMKTVMSGKPIPEFVDKKIVSEIWQDIVKTANKHYQPGKFTAFIGTEWSSNGPNGTQNMHRNIIFRGDKATDLPFTTFDSVKPEDLWTFQEGARKQGFTLLAIPHNPNMSDGLMFRPNYSDGPPIDKTYAQRRMLNEPLVEIKQAKGASETHPLLSPDDEFASFEISDYSCDLSAFGTARSKAKGGYVRDAYRSGLVLEEQLGVNPFKFGIIASGDTHNAAGTYRHDTFFGHMSGEDGSPEKRLLGHGQLSNMIKTWGTTGLAGVWAEGNTRESLHDALARKETFGTSGTRIRTRFFGGWDYKAGDHQGDNVGKTGYEKGVPMGSDLTARPDRAKTPTFIVQAEKDSDAANLDRIQIIKGWAKHGQSFEKIYNVAWSGVRSPDPKSGRLPPVGNTVNIAEARYSNTIGSENLSAVWQDPDFDPTLRAFYYVRVLEIPTPRWSAYDAKKLKITAPEPATVQERAWTSPIWYMPTEADLARGRESAITVASLEKDKAKALTTDELKQLLVGNTIRIKNLQTGAEYDAVYGEDGMRTLTATVAFAASHGQGAAKNSYLIKDGKLFSGLADGSLYSSRLYKQGGRYLAAKDDEVGYVNYEFIRR